MTRRVKRGGKIWIRIFPDKPITQKPLEVRQGKGKGSVEYWVAQIQPGRVMFEIEGVDETLAREAFSLADRIAVMEGGRIVQQGPAREVYSRPASAFVHGFLGTANVAPGEVVGGVARRTGIVCIAIKLPF